MDKENTNDKSFDESANKKLEEIIEQSKAENAALKKLLAGLEKLELKIDKPNKRKGKSKK